MRQWIDERGEQYDEDFFVYSFVPGATTNGQSATLAPGASAIAQVHIQQDSAFEWSLSTMTATDNASDAFLVNPNISIQITDSATGRNLFNEMTPVVQVAGYAQYPYVLPFPRRFMPKSTVTIAFTNFDTAKTFKLIQFSMIGRKIFMRKGGRPIQRFRTLPKESIAASRRLGRPVSLAEDFFVYHFGFGAIAQGAQPGTVTQLVESDSDFEARLLSATNWNALNTGQGGDPDNFMYFQIKDGGSERQLSNTPVSGENYAGGGGLPLILPVPRIFLAQTDMIVQAWNNSAATNSARFDVALAGRKVFEFEDE